MGDAGIRRHASRPLRPLVLVLAAALLAAVPAAAASRPSFGPPAGAPAGAHKADRDRDGVFDDLEARLRGKDEAERVRVIVTLDAKPTADRVRGLERRVGDFRVGDRFAILDGFSGTVTKAQVRRLAAAPDVVRVEEDSPVHASNDTAQSSFGVAKARLDAPSLDGSLDGNSDVFSKSDLVAAVIDTGIHASHLDLDEGKVIAFKDFVGGRTTPYDDNGHGTHVAATIAGDGDARTDRLHRGVAPGAALVGVKVLNAQGSGSMSTIVSALDWVVANRVTHGIEAINLSLGAAGCSNGTDATSLAVNRAHDAGLVVAVAAGNEGPRACSIGTPAAAAKALTVGAMADMGAGGFFQAYFSSRGKTADGRIKPDVSAPGVSITSARHATTTGYVAFSGTSMATPFVAGVALLMQDASTSLTPQQVKDRIMSSAVDWGRGGDGRTAGSLGADIEYGAGRLDAYAALAAAGATIGAPPPVPAHELREGSLGGSGLQVEYQLNVVDTRFPVAVTLIHPTVSGATATSPNFDIALIDPTGAQVAVAATTRRQEQFGFRPTRTGTYRLRVRSISGAAPFFLDVSAGLGVAPPPVPTTSLGPGATVIETGSAGGGSAAALAADDDGYLQVNSTTFGSPTASWYGTIGAVPNGLRDLTVSYKGKNSRSCAQSVAIWRWTTSSWVQLDSRTVGGTEVNLAGLVAPGAAGDYVSGTTGDGEVRVRVRCVSSFGGFVASGDLMKITFART